MSSKWNSKYAIMQDLYLAQGCEVPAELEGTVSAGEKPPVLNILEETEEAFFKHCEGGGDFQAAPDFSLIKEMLEMIQDKNILKDNEKQSDSVIEISKPRNTVQTKEKADVIKKNITSDNNCEKPNNKIKKKHKNVAVSSILEAKAAVMSAQATAHVESNEKEALKLLKPNDFMMSDTEIAESVEKVNDWLDSHQENTNRVLTCQPNLMFKKKSISAQNSIDSGSIKSSPKPVPTKTTITMFQPTQLAAEYYKKYVERSKLNESVQEDIWKRAENIMRKIDTKRRLQAVEISQPTTSQSTCNDATENKEMTDKVRLSHHRHLLTHKCVVCEAIEKNGIEVNTKIVYSDEFDTCPLLPENVVKNA